MPFSLPCPATGTILLMRITTRTKTIAFFITLGVCLVGVAVTLNITWMVLNWLLATSAVLTVADRGPGRGNFLSAVRLLQQYPGPVLVTAISFGILQMLGIAALCGAALSVLAIVGSSPAALLFLEEGALLGHAPWQRC